MHGEQTRLALLISGETSNTFMARAQFWLGKELVDRGWGELYVAEIPTHTPDVGLGLGNEPLERNAIAVAGGDQQARQAIHGRKSRSIDRNCIVTDFIEPPGTKHRRATTATTMDTTRSDPPSTDPPNTEPVDCAIAREALSARADGEASIDEGASADHHLESCAPCRNFAAIAIKIISKSNIVTLLVGGVKTNAFKNLVCGKTHSWNVEAFSMAQCEARTYFVNGCGELPKCVE